MAMDLEGLACLVERQFGVSGPSFDNLSRLVELELFRGGNLCHLPTALLLQIIEQGYDPLQSKDIYLKLQRVIQDLKRGTRVRYDLFRFNTLQEEYKHKCEFELRKVRSNYVIQMVDKLLKSFFEHELASQAAYYRQITRSTCCEDAGEFAQYWISNYPMLLYFKSNLVQAVELRSRLLELPFEQLQREFIRKSFSNLAIPNIEHYRIDEFIWEALSRAEFWNLFYDWPYWKSHFAESNHPYPRQHHPNILRKRQRGRGGVRVVSHRPRLPVAPTPVDETAERFVSDLLDA